jgi:hypothetical protein
VWNSNFEAVASHSLRPGKEEGSHAASTHSNDLNESSFGFKNTHIFSFRADHILRQAHKKIVRSEPRLCSADLIDVALAGMPVLNGAFAPQFSPLAVWRFRENLANHDN